MTNIANWKIHCKWRFLAGKIICFYGPLLPVRKLFNQRGPHQKSWFFPGNPHRNSPPHSRAAARPMTTNLFFHDEVSSSARELGAPRPFRPCSDPSDPWDGKFWRRFHSPILFPLSHQSINIGNLFNLFIIKSSIIQYYQVQVYLP